MSHPKITMTGMEFSLWAAAMVANGVVQKEAELPALLGLTRQGFWLIKGRGCDQRTALACSAIEARLSPWSESEQMLRIKQSS